MTTAERQARFLERHPGYYARLRAKRKAKMEAYAAARALAAARVLALPAPVEMPIIPGMNTIQATPAPAPLQIELPR